MKQIQFSILSDGSEQVPYNDKRYPLYAGGGSLRALPDMSFTYHWHDDWEFGYIESGHMDYSINGEIVTLKAGDGIFINSRHMHRNYSSDGTDCYYCCIEIHPTLMHGILPALDARIDALMRNDHFAWHILHPDIPWENELLKLVRHYHDTILKDVESNLPTLLGDAFQITQLLLDHQPEAGASPVIIDRRVPSLRSMVGYIQSHYAEKITLTDICRAGTVGTGTCYEIFKKNMNMTPMSYLMTYRLEKAIDLLHNPGLSITDVAYATGFTGASYFTESFRKQYGITPTEFRKRG